MMYPAKRTQSIAKHHATHHPAVQSDSTTSSFWVEVQTQVHREKTGIAGVRRLHTANCVVGRVSGVFYDTAASGTFEQPHLR